MKITIPFERASDFWDKAKPYLWPWFIGPFCLLYVFDLLSAVILILKVIAAAYLVLNVLGVGLGIVAGVLDKMNDGSNNPYSWLPRSRLAWVFVGLKYGYQSADWLTTEPEEKPKRGRPKKS